MLFSIHPIHSRCSLTKSFFSFCFLISNLAFAQLAKAEPALAAQGTFRSIKVFDGRVQICDQENLNATATRIVSASTVLSPEASASSEIKVKLSIVFLRCEKTLHQQPQFVIIRKEATQIRTAEENKALGNEDTASKMSLENHKISVMSVSLESQRLALADLHETKEKLYEIEFAVPSSQNKVDVLLVAERVLEIQGDAEKNIDSIFSGAFRLILK